MHACFRQYMYIYIYIHTYTHIYLPGQYGVASISRLLKIIVSFAKEPYKRDQILQKRPIF